MTPDKTSPNAHGDAADDEGLPELHPSALRTGVFRVLTGMGSLLMGWALWNSFSWDLLLLVCILAYQFIPFTLMGYDAQRILTPWKIVSAGLYMSACHRTHMKQTGLGQDLGRKTTQTSGSTDKRDPMPLPLHFAGCAVNTIGEPPGSPDEPR